MAPPSPPSGLFVIAAILTSAEAYVNRHHDGRCRFPLSKVNRGSCKRCNIQPADDGSSPRTRPSIGLSYTSNDIRDRHCDPPGLLASGDPSPPPFTSWEDLLRKKTRAGHALSSIPSFVDFCRRHESLATKFGSDDKGTAGTGRAHIRNQLQGGLAAGPLATTRAGQSVRAGSYYSGLTAAPRHFNETYKHDTLAWTTELQRRLPAIQDELSRVLPSLPDGAWESLRTRRGREWSDDTGWAHVALIDNFRRRDDVCVHWFPETARILDDVVGTERRMGPRLVAIARQKARTGIPEHYDYMNWMLTLHTALSGPREGAGIVVDGVRRDWTVGDPVVMDTTFAHSTYNESDEDLYLLLVDFWHPDLSDDEIDALRTFFAANSGV